MVESASCYYLSVMVDLNEEQGSDMLEQLLGSLSSQGQSGSYWNVQSEFGFPSWPAARTRDSHNYESLQN